MIRQELEKKDRLGPIGERALACMVQFARVACWWNPGLASAPTVGPGRPGAASNTRRVRRVRVRSVAVYFTGSLCRPPHAHLRGLSRDRLPHDTQLVQSQPAEFRWADPGVPEGYRGREH